MRWNTIFGKKTKPTRREIKSQLDAEPIKREVECQRQALSKKINVALDSRGD